MNSALAAEGTIPVDFATVFLDVLALDGCYLEYSGDEAALRG
jgi:hypothetical protein